MKFSVLTASAGLLAAVANAQATATVVGRVAGSAQHTTLNDIISSAKYQGVKDALDLAQDKTLFAPDNDAFTTFLANGGTQLDDPVTSTDDDFIATVTEILQYHLVAGDALTDAELISSVFTETAMGTSVKVEDDSGTKVNGVLVDASFTEGDGIVHSVGTVLALPPSIVEHATSETPELAAVVAGNADLLAALTAPTPLDPVTVFAPNDQAFTDYGTLSTDADNVTSIVSYHVVPGKIFAAVTPDGTYEFETLMGQELTVVVSTDQAGAKSVTVNGAVVVTADVNGKNGVVHVIDTVLVPPPATPAPTSSATSLVPGLAATIVAAVTAFFN